MDILQERIFAGTIEIEFAGADAPGRIAGITETGPEDSSLDYVLPGFIDSHVHIESTLLTPANYAPLASEHGVTGAICDPHEIANVLGVEGVDYMLGSAAQVRFNFHFAASPCVPSTAFEHSGAVLDSAAVEALLRKDGIYGLGEMMNVPGLVFGDPEVLAKVGAARRLGKPIDGHMPGASEEWVKICAGAGIVTDHECSDLGEAELRLENGISVLIREGSAARNFSALHPLLSEDRHRGKLMFCSDDKYADDLQSGYIDDLVRESVRLGHPLWNVLRAACINPVLTYGTADGILRQGDKADFIVVSDLNEFAVKGAYVGGRKAGERLSSGESAPAPNNFKALPLQASDIAVPAKGGGIRVIRAFDGELLTESVICDARVEDGMAVSDTDNDVLKLIVYNRYTPGAKPAVGFVSGFALKSGAIACSIGHDSHNITALGCSDGEIARAVNALVESRGGMAVVSPTEGTVVLPLPVAGLMSDEPGEKVAAQYRKIKEAVLTTGCTLQAPLMTMSFLPLPVIPKLKLTDIALFDSEKFEFCELFPEGARRA